MFAPVADTEGQRVIKGGGGLMYLGIVRSISGHGQLAVGGGAGGGGTVQLENLAVI